MSAKVAAVSTSNGSGELKFKLESSDSVNKISSGVEFEGNTRPSIFEQPTAWFSRRSARDGKGKMQLSSRSKRKPKRRDPEFVRLNAL